MQWVETIWWKADGRNDLDAATFDPLGQENIFKQLKQLKRLKFRLWTSVEILDIHLLTLFLKSISQMFVEARLI